MSLYNHDLSLLINAGLSHKEAESIAEQTHWDRFKATYEELRAARREGDTIRASIARHNINAQYGKLGGVSAKGLLYK